MWGVCWGTLSSLRLAWLTFTLNAPDSLGWGRMKRLLYALEAGVSDCCERFGNFWETTDRKCFIYRFDQHKCEGSRLVST